MLFAMDDIRDTRPWFWILLAALAAVAIVALVIAISASNEGVDQKQAVNEATAQIKEEVSGLNTGLEAANEFQEESDELAAQDRKRIKREVNAAVAGGEGELRKLKKRVASLEGDIETIAAEGEKLRKSNANLLAGQERLTKSNSNLRAGQEDLEAEVAEFDKQVTRLQKQVE
jgi:predicted  nucleic acid-binding Zn-ribbon protein